MFANGTATRYSVAFINIKHVNQLNRYFGSDIAGSAIKMFGAKLNSFPNKDKGEFAVHLGGDNFVVVVQTQNLPELISFIRAVPVSLSYGGDRFEHIFNCRAGITTIRPNHRFGNHVMGECSQAFSYSKQNNIDVVYYTEEINEKNHNNTETLTRALNEHKFLIYYQPVISIEDKPVLHAAEALARWPLDGKIMSPQEFITLATDSGIVTKIDFYVLENVCKNIKSWQEQGLSIVPISINFSGRHLFNASIATDILAVIDKYGVDHNLIGIEFSEPDFTQRMPILNVVSHTLSEAGVLVTLDKFSTGQSTLTLLHDMDASYVKIGADRFDPDDTKGRIITNDMINLANTLGYKVICEGVESQKQVDDLRMCGCSLFQSFFFDKPMSERFFINRLQNPSYDYETIGTITVPVTESSENAVQAATAGESV
jgi:EAL domain-containing protein (putative c-di-GMP-specific phosphodiesterase class I)